MPHSEPNEQRVRRLTSAILAADPILVERAGERLSAIADGSDAERSYYSDGVILATLQLAARNRELMMALQAVAMIHPD